MRTLPAIIILLFLLATAFARNALWRDDGTIWGDSIAKSPRKSRGYNEIGLHLLEQGKYQEAYEVLSRSISVDPYQPVIYVNLGLALERLGQYEYARTTYERAISFNPGDPNAFYNLGVLHYTVFKNSEKAFGYFLQARDLNPLEPDVHQFLGQIYSERGDQARSAEEWRLYGQLKH
jgi:tetratricopeptide (TPR) repeat protein